ncbi:MipA/OmpV family protein [Microbulbifer spongiae]|uniref:MipA/OmpV family protein n=1 Tax=Microbulbifer spongiae TaxID=2944933 RepID=A0ABY9E7C0_9GAMM|nr:MipA/OmpV family protein [Microbulbifer sp. MI-G]WKD48567.1 MipA/OmpV family protein [Microbulbifer sp. MI-G]
MANSHWIRAISLLCASLISYSSAASILNAHQEQLIEAANSSQTHAPTTPEGGSGSGPQSDDFQGGYLKVGFGYKIEEGFYDDEVKKPALFVSGRYQVKWGFFVEASSDANRLDQGLNIGFNFYNTEQWQFDLTSVRAHGRNKYSYGQSGFHQEEKIKSSEMLGLRATGLFENQLLQLVVAPYSFNDEYNDGVYASLFASNAWQIKNWEVYVSAGLVYRSEEILDYYYSTTELQSQLDFPDYQAGAGIDFVGQIGASYPISENILFETYYRYTNISSSITDSPIVKLIIASPERKEDITEFGLLVSYVF